MGEAKRRKEAGLPPKRKKNNHKTDTPNFFKKLQKNQIFPIVLASGFVIFLIYDLIKYYNQS